MTKGNNELEQTISSLSYVMDLVTNNKERYKKHLNEIGEKLQNLKQEINIMQIVWEGREKNAMGFFEKRKARKKLLYLKECETEVNQLLLDYEEIVKEMNSL